MNDNEKYIIEILDQLYQQEKIDEGLKDYISAPLIAAIMAIPGILDAETLERYIPRQATRADVVKVLEYKNPIKKEISGYSFVQAVDILARTLYMEAANQGDDGIKAIMSIIWNRAGGDIENIIPVVFRPSQFSGWNSANPSMKSGPYCPKNYDLWVPKYLMDEKTDRVSQPALAVWNKCKELAAEVLSSEQFSSTIGNCNMIINPKKDRADYYEFWKDRCQYTLKDHKFAYDPTYDGWLSPDVRRQKMREFQAEIDGEKSKENQVASNSTQNNTSTTQTQSATDSDNIETFIYTVSKSDFGGIGMVAQNLIKRGEIKYTTSTSQLTRDIISLNPDLKKNRKGETIIIPGDKIIIPRTV